MLPQVQRARTGAGRQQGTSGRYWTATQPWEEVTAPPDGCSDPLCSLCSSLWPPRGIRRELALDTCLYPYLLKGNQDRTPPLKHLAARLDLKDRDHSQEDPLESQA